MRVLWRVGAARRANCQNRQLSGLCRLGEWVETGHAVVSEPLPFCVACIVCTVCAAPTSQLLCSRARAYILYTRNIRPPTADRTSASAHQRISSRNAPCRLTETHTRQDAWHDNVGYLARRAEA